MANVKIKLNGNEVIAQEGQTILEVARENGIEIPTLCHDEHLKPFGSCWVCLVEVKGARGFVPSCATEVREGMEIETDNENVHSARRMALELLLSDHYADCTAPCTLACPAHVDVQGYIALVHDGLYHEAVKLIKERLPLPLSVGRVCPAFCEKECRRQIVEEPIAIRQIKRFAADKDIEDAEYTYIPEKKPSTGKEVAIVGAGPAGLTAAYYLTIEGHHCTIFEANPKSGGMMRYGIPEYRLPKRILDKEIELIEKLGVDIKNNERLGRDFTLQFLYKEYDAIFLGLGAQNAMRMRIEGEDLDGCYFGVEFLKGVVEGKIKKIGKIVAVIGGGNTAIDAARTALRLGAEKVMIIYRRAEEQMPAEKEEIEAAKEEGIELHLLQNPTKILGKEGKVVGMQCLKMRLGEPDSSGRRRPIPIPNSEFIMKVDAVIPAISQFPDTKFLLDETSKITSQNIELTRRGTLVVNENTMQTNIEKIFAGGDVTRGPATVIECVADAYTAAHSMNQFLSGKEIVPVKDMFNSKKAESVKDIDPREYEKYEKKPRLKSGTADIETRIKSFEEVERIFTEKEVFDETGRCLECGCADNKTCALRKYATDYNAIATRFIGEVNKHPIDETHPFIIRDPNKCIKCGRCVRTCLEIQGVGALGYIYRGFGTLVAPEFGESLLNTSCETCGKCIDVCPVGALSPRNAQIKTAPIELKETITTCGLCGCGCQVKFKSVNNLIMQAEAAESPITENNICFNAHFGYEVLQGDKRLTTPFIRKEHTLQRCSWDEAFKLIAEKLPEFGINSAIFSNGNFTNEELYLINQIAEKYKIQKKYSWELNGSIVQEKLGINYSPNPTSDLLSTDLIVLVGDIPHTLGIKIIQAVRRGKKLLVISPDENKFSRIADYYIKSDNYLEIFNQFAKYFLEYRYHNVSYIADCVENFVEYNHELQRSVHKNEYYKFAKLIVKVEKAIFVYSETALDINTQSSILNLSILKGDIGEEGSGIITCSELANKPTLQHYGFIPSSIRYQVSSIKSALIFGEDPLYDNKLETYNWLNGLDFLLVADNYLTETAKMANVVLPISTFAETNGRFVNNNNVFQTVNKVISSPGGKENWEIFAKILDYQMNFENLVREANKDNSNVLNKESRFAIAESGRKVSLQFDNKKAVSKASINYNNCRRKIDELKKANVKGKR